VADLDGAAGDEGLAGDLGDAVFEGKGPVQVHLGGWVDFWGLGVGVGLGGWAGGWGCFREAGAVEVRVGEASSSWVASESCRTPTHPPNQPTAAPQPMTKPHAHLHALGLHLLHHHLDVDLGGISHVLLGLDVDLLDETWGLGLGLGVMMIRDGLEGSV